METFHVFLVSKEKQQGFVMDAFDPAQATASSSVTKLLPALGGLLVATVVAFSAASPPTHYLLWTGVLTFALQRLFAVSLASVLTVAVVCAIVSRGKHFDSHLLLVQTSRVAIWLAPLALLMRANSALGMKTSPRASRPAGSVRRFGSTSIVRRLAVTSSPVVPSPRVAPGRIGRVRSAA